MGLFTIKCVSEGPSQSLSSHSGNCTTFYYPAMTGHNAGEMPPVFMWEVKV